MVRLWDASDPAAPPKVITGHEASVLGVAFSPDGRTLASASADGTIRHVIVSAEELSELVCRTVLRNLTLAEWRQFVGAETAYERTCPNLPPGEGAPPDPAFGATPTPSDPS